MPNRHSSSRSWSSFCLGGATVFAGVLLWQTLGNPPAAQAQFPDAAKQRVDLVNEQKNTNKKLTEIAGYLREIRDMQKGTAGKPGDTQTKKPAKGTPPRNP